MNDRNATARGGEYKPSITGASSVQMEERSVLRRMEKERRSQEVQQEETQYDRITPLFSAPFKRLQGDALSSRVQRMLGSFEGSDAEGVCVESWARVPAEPLSPLQSSGSGTPSPERRSAPPLALPLHTHCTRALSRKPTAYVRPLDGPELTHTPPLKEARQQDLKESSQERPAPEWPTDVGSVRVRDILQEMSAWPPLLTSIRSPHTLPCGPQEPHGGTAHTPEASDGVQPDPRERSSCSSDSSSSSDADSEKSSSPAQPETTHTPDQHTHTPEHRTHTPDQHTHTPEHRTHTPDQHTPDQHTQTAEHRTPVLHTKTHTPDCRIHTPDRHTHSPDHLTHSTDRHTPDCHTRTPEHHPPDPHTHSSERHTHTLERHTLPSPGSGRTSRDICSHDPSGEAEAAGAQVCFAVTDGVADHRPTVGHTHTCETPRTEHTHRSQHVSAHRGKHKRKRTTTDGSAHTHRSAHTPPLLVKIELTLLSRIPRPPGAHPQRSRASTARTRAADTDEKSPKKKQKLDKDGKCSSSQRGQSEASRSRDAPALMKRSRTHAAGPRQDGPEPRAAAAPDQQRTAEAHGKRSCKSRSVPETACASADSAPACRPRSVEDHLKEAKKLKHRADATVDKTAKAFLYLEAALAFMESGVAMETEAEPQTPKSAYTMLSETLELIRFILKLKNYTDPSATARDRDFFILCLRCQALLQMAMFRYRRDTALRYSRTLAEHFRSSSRSASPSASSLVLPPPVQQVASAYVSITALFLSAHESWEHADALTHTGSGVLRELDSAASPLSLTSSVISLVQYTRQGLERLRADTH